MRTSNTPSSNLGRRAVAAALAIVVSLGAVACSDDDEATNIVEGSELVDETPGESFDVDSQADLACVNAFDAAANDQAPLSVTLEACVDAEQWYDVAGGFGDLVDPDAQAEVLESLCADVDEDLATFC